MTNYVNRAGIEVDPARADFIETEILNALEKGEREGGAKPAAIIDDLPLFAAAAPRETPKSEPIPPQYAEVAKLLDTTHPDELSPREALDLLYKLKEASRQ